MAAPILISPLAHVAPVRNQECFYQLAFATDHHVWEAFEPIAFGDFGVKLPNGDLQLTFEGVLQSSPDMNAPNGGWTDVTPAPTSPYVIPKAQIGGAKFFRSSKP